MAHSLHNLEVLRRSVKLFRLWPFTPEAAEVYGRLDAILRRNGRTIDPAGRPSDQIVAIALALGQCNVVSEDSDLSSVPGLSVENWAVQNVD